MKKTWLIFLCIPFLLFTASSTFHKKNDLTEDIRTFYSNQFKLLVKELEKLHSLSLQSKVTTATFQEQFKKARLAYKPLETIIEYYFDLDVAKINGPALDFIEDEDPTAIQELQGFQVMETYLFPKIDTSHLEDLKVKSQQLLNLAKGLGGNAENFDPGNYIVDAGIEEVYRLIALYITGFDSPLALQSLPESSKALNGIKQLIEICQKHSHKDVESAFRQAIAILEKSTQFLQQQNDFNKIDRMKLITEYLNPLCEKLTEIRSEGGYESNPLHEGAIKKQGSLFRLSNLVIGKYLYGDIPTSQKISLGKKLFFDTRLSSTGTRSCATCHIPGKGFAENRPKALPITGHGSLPRNTPTLWNASLQQNLFYDSRQHNMDLLIREVLSNEKEMNSGPDRIALELNSKEEYKKMISLAYPKSKEGLTGNLLVNAISHYVHSLISYSAPFDRFMRGDKKAMPNQAINGFNLFMGKARCATCHFLPFFNGSKPTLYLYQESEVIGVPENNNKKFPKLDPDKGREVATGKAFHRNAFKTPTLRNITLTAPYMHNGVFLTLKEVLEFYNKGGGKGLGVAPENQTLPFDKLKLTEKEREEIIQFLHTLTDTSGNRFSKIGNPN